MTLLYQAGGQLLRVRLINLLALAVAGGCLWAGVALVQSFGLSSAEGAMMRPLEERLMVGGGVAALGLAFWAGMWVYGRCYVAALAYDQESERLQITMAGFLWTSRIVAKRNDLRPGSHHLGRVQGRIRGYAPWSTFSLEGRRLPFILDDQGEFLDRRAVDDLLSGAWARN